MILVIKKKKLKKRVIFSIVSIVLIFFMSASIVSALSKVVTLTQEKMELKKALVEKENEKKYLEIEMTRLEDEE